MIRKLIVDFTKMTGAGNDFIVVDNRFFHFSDPELGDIAKRLCPRRTGIGADGLLALSAPEEPDHHFRMRYFNADGSHGMMCGNGGRCIARFAWMAGIEGEKLTFSTDAGIYAASLVDEESGTVRLFVPPPERFLEKPKIITPLPSEISGFHYIWTGTDHLVCFTPNVEDAPVEELGRALRGDSAFQPTGTNVDFVAIETKDGDTIQVRTYERGVEDETLACGTGAIASAIVSRLIKKVTSNTIQVRMPGGTLRVGFDMDASERVSNVYLEGPTEVVFRGTFEL